ncbi:MAG: penicillin-binding protein 2 [Solirubrobacteraceae bacterium]|nr:penicillin-binding protein 2 [Solirubrobacteraceae bacterium]
MPLIERRIGLLFASFFVLLAIAGLRVCYLGLVKGPGLANAAAAQQVAVAKLPAERGTITDHNGVPLASSIPADDISATPYLIKDPVATANRLAPLIGVPANKLVTDLARRDTGFVYLARHVPAGAADKIRALKIDGIDFAPGALRTYPRGALAAQVLGVVGVDGNGLFGLEYAHDKVLRGRDGEQRRVLDGGRQAIETRDIKRAVPGAAMALSLDAEIQLKAEEVLQSVADEYRPKGATAIVTNPKTGAVLAMANWPKVDANDPGSAPAEAVQNRSLGMTFEPGSTFKAFTVAAALEDKKVEPDTSFNLAPSIQVADRVIGESHERGWVTLDTGGILAQSSNVGAIMVGQRLGAKRFSQWVNKFGFGQPTGVDLPGEERGLITPLEEYSGSSMGNMPIGQGQLVTPLQMVSAYGAIANGGKLLTPRVVNSVNGKPTAGADDGERIISAKTAATVREMLTGVFQPGGTASEVAIPGYELAGKTGTANKIDPATGTYSDSQYVASFVGMAPAADPELLISVVVDEPQGDIYGGSVAAPAFGKIAAFALPYLRIAPK